MNADTDPAATPEREPPGTASAGRPDGTASDRRASGAEADVPGTGLLSEGDLLEMQRRWEEIQGRFVDSPQGAVADADALLADVIERIRTSLDSSRASLEERWRTGREPSTEDLRRTLQQYRSFFSQVLTSGSR
jgi:hypothetical protein